MKIGFSLSGCVKDIINGKVHFADVMVICTRTNFSLEQIAKWDDIWSWYKDGVWSDIEEAKAKNMVFRLWKAGKIHQPRMYKNDVSWNTNQPMWCDIV